MKRIERIFLLIITAIALQTTLVANAQADLLTKLDMDQDGVISLKEAVSNTDLLRQFGRIDTNEDGKLSPEELKASGKITVIPVNKKIIQ
ncbi:calcium-binding protein [Alteromonas sp. ASW11-130]|uniref:calcium-binding protein n=1 Tax=Alteromonas sp. ASW11-130 TaxID=3015775 RepID=UPI0022429F72|nr:calcium-binding protein [Alteromonas sp. ASW11-130]MCW8091474.1 calcium-binding protein [Alteromonas sp. ASW11-130]